MIHQRTDNNNNVLLISFESSPNEEELEKAFLKIVDFGGHQVRETSEKETDLFRSTLVVRSFSFWTMGYFSYVSRLEA